MRAAVAAVEGEHGAVGVLVNNAGYSQSGAIETVPMEKVRDAVRDQRVRPRAPVPARAARDAAAALRARSSTSPRWAGSSSSRAAASTTRPSTRWRRSPTRCASRSRASAIDVILIEPGLIRTAFGETAVGRRGGGGRGRGRLRAVQRPRRARDRERLRVRQPDRAPRRAAGGGREGDREGAERQAPARPLHGHAVGEAADRPARRCCPTAAWDAVMRSQFPSPGR